MNTNGNERRVNRLLRECKVSAIPALLTLATCVWLALWPPSPQLASSSVPYLDAESTASINAPAP